MRKTKEYTVCDLCKGPEVEATCVCLVCGADICSSHRRDWEPHQGGNGPMNVRAKISVCDHHLPHGFGQPTLIIRKVNEILVRAFDDINFELIQSRQKEKTKCSS